VSRRPLAASAGLTPLVERVVSHIEEARSRVVRSVNTSMVMASGHIGREIVEFVQRGSRRAEYGDQVLEALSRQLQSRVGRGDSVTNLRYRRLFYLRYRDRVPQFHHERRDESPGGFSSRLSWTHYRTLTRVEDPQARNFYEREAASEQWSVPHLERQISTQLHLQLLKSRNNQGVRELARKGQVVERPMDPLKSPVVLDFLDLPDRPQWRESDLEGAVIGKLSHFPLEPGKGFAFVARQKRLSFEEDAFFIGLVSYNAILKRLLLVDLKLGKLTHQDFGQMDSCVRLFDAQGRTAGDGPTLGLILCAEKNETLARYSVLHEHERLFAAKYVTYLPTVEGLERELPRDRQIAEDVVDARPPRRRSRARPVGRGSKGRRR